MHRIDVPSATPDHLFTEGSPTAGVPATQVSASWMNDVQENLMAVLSAAGVTPTKGRAQDLLDAILASANGRLLNVQVFNASGTYTPTPGMKYAIASVQGGGGAGAGATVPSAGNASIGAPGNPGAFAKGKILAAEIGASKPVTVGDGGVANVSGNGGNGGISSIGSLITAAGGAGGTMLNNAAVPNVSANSSTSGSPTGGDIFEGVGLGSGLSLALTTTTIYGGAGGATTFGPGGPFNSVNNGGNAGEGYGSGGSGVGINSSSGSGLPGGEGKDGIVIIEEFS